MVGLFAGTWAGSRIVLHPLLAGAPELLVTAPVDRPARVRLPSWLKPAAGVLVAIATLAGAAAYLLAGDPRLATVLLFGAGFGLAIERGRICFTAAFREFWITRQTHMARALAVAMAAASLGFALAIAAGVVPKSEPASLGALIGGAIFGLGIVIAGGCETGWMYRASQGYAQLWMAGVGTILGTIVLAYGWGAWGLYDLLVGPFAAVNLADLLGLPGAVVLTLAGLGAWYAFSIRREPRALAGPSPEPAGAIAGKEA